MLADIITGILTDTFIGVGISIKNKIVLFVIGLLVMAISTRALFYIYSLPPANVEDYYNTQINYSIAYFEDSKNYSNVILVSREQNYIISSRIWQKSYSPETVIDKLNNVRRAKTWLSSPDSNEIKGIITKGFSIDPSIELFGITKINMAGVFWLVIFRTR